MRRDLSPDELDRFLAAPIVATLATYRADGRVLLSPVWYEWRDGGFDVVIGADDVKARHIRRDSRVGFAVSQSVVPFAGLELHAFARIVGEGGPETDRRMAVRYLGEERGNAYADRSASSWPNVLVRLEPGEMRTWDFADEFGD